MTMIKKHTTALFQKLAKAWMPPPKLTVSEWADQKRKLSPESSAEPGQWRTDRAPYQREPMDSVTDPRIEKIVLMFSAQVGKTEVELNVAGYFIDQDPCSIMVVLPNKDPMAKDWSRDRLAPMIRDTEVLAAKVSDPKSRDGENSTLHKRFPGGLIVIAGANSPADLKSRPMRILLCDEVDSFGTTAEGDPIALAEKRSVTYWNRKKILVSTPTIEGASRIEEEYNKGTKEKWNLVCPECGCFNFLNIYGMKFDHEWVSADVAEVTNVTFRCEHCLQEFDEFTWKRQKGQWIAENPHIQGVRSFHLNAFYSPWYGWNAIIKEWLEAKKDPQKLMVVFNTLFGIPWKEKLDLEDEDKLLQRREEYKADLPEGVLLLTCGVDTQDDRLEYEIVGWGKEDESWGIEFGIIIGKPDDPETWKMLDERLNKIYRFENGQGLKIYCTFIDSGGHFTTEVYKYCKKNERRRIFAIKGYSGSGIPLIKNISRNNKENVMLVLLGVDDGKMMVMSALKEKKIGPRYCHFPADERRGYDRRYFNKLLSERQVLKKIKGRNRYVWENIADDGRNEALDTRNYAQAAKEIIRPNYEALERTLKAMSGEKVITGQSQNKPPGKRRGTVKKGIEY